MTPWPTGVPKPEAVREYEALDGYVLGYPGEEFPAVAIDKQDADAMLDACAEVIERLDGMLDAQWRKMNGDMPMHPSWKAEWLADLACRYAEQKAADAPR